LVQAFELSGISPAMNCNSTMWSHCTPATPRLLVTFSRVPSVGSFGFLNLNVVPGHLRAPRRSPSVFPQIHGSVESLHCVFALALRVVPFKGKADVDNARLRAATTTRDAEDAKTIMD